MSDALRLPPRPDQGQYRKLAKDLQSACRSGDPAQIAAWAAGWTATIARLHGREITPDVQHEIDEDTQRVLRVWSHLRKKGDERVTRCALTDAQFFIARAHGF